MYSRIDGGPFTPSPPTTLSLAVRNQRHVCEAHVKARATTGEEPPCDPEEAGCES